MNFLRLNITLGLLIFATWSTVAQNPLTIPPALTGTNFNLTIQSGTTTFYSGYNTPTYGINGVWMAPTLIINKGDSVTFNVTNNLPVNTTIHWHGLHLPSKWDGGPHQIITPTSTWSPRFKVMNDAATYWYHPHGDMKTELHVTKGIAGMIIVKDVAEAALTLPRTYGVDDFPIIVQSKAFDVLKQLAIATEDDSTIMVNGTMYPYLNAPAQVIRMRLLNGSTMRTYLFGFSGNIPFKLIGTDDGLLDTATTLTRIRLSPGERAEILVNLTGMQSQTVYLKNYGAELPNGIHGAAIVATGAAAIQDYNLNPLNGGNYNILQLNVVAQTSSPVTTTPTTLIAQTPINPATAQKVRRILLEPQPPVDSSKMTEGPFLMNGKSFDMTVINDTVKLGQTEIWELINKTLIAHPFHIHDVFFNVLNINVNPPSLSDRGKKDVVLVMPGDTLRFISKFEDFADPVVPFMYHCHLLHHEDEGMMGSFVVIDSTTSIKGYANMNISVNIYPNPAHDELHVEGLNKNTTIQLYDVFGREVYKAQSIQDKTTISLANLVAGNYVLQLTDANGERTVIKINKE
ncbi:MAG: multicopper oxidase domain-containing protein [Bacteroidetes bacterium]|nr:multicopper oxidase domain-containing protein [Bacteroidota bacterium]